MLYNSKQTPLKSQRRFCEAAEEVKPQAKIRKRKRNKLKAAAAPLLGGWDASCTMNALSLKVFCPGAEGNPWKCQTQIEVH